MRKIRKFLRILLILLPFSLLGFCFATEFDGNSVYDGVYIDNSHTITYDEIDDAISSILDNVFFDGFADIINGFGKGLRDGKEYSEIAVQNYNEFIPFIEHYGTYGTIKPIAGEEFTSNEWAIPYQISVVLQYQYSYRDYPDQGSYWTEYVSFNIDDINGDLNGSYTDPWGATCVYSYSRGIIRYSFDFSNVDTGIVVSDDTLVRAKVFSYTNSVGGVNKIITPYPAGDYWLVATRDCSITDGNTINIESGRYDYLVKMTSTNSFFQILWYDFTFGGVPAYEPPVLQYPQKTYIDNSTGDTVTNNYYDEEVYYYNYMTNVINQIENAGSGEDFEIDMEWGLLNLPAGVALGVLDALGEWTDVCSFRTQSITIDLGEHDFTFPALNFEFDAGDYGWLTPFRYIITIFILLGLSKACWKLINELINSGGNSDVD